MGVYSYPATTGEQPNDDSRLLFLLTMPSANCISRIFFDATYPRSRAHTHTHRLGLSHEELRPSKHFDLCILVGQFGAMGRGPSEVFRAS